MTPDEAKKPTPVLTSVMTLTTVAGVPNVEKTPRRTVRVPDELWQAALEAAKESGETVTDVVNRCLAEYVKRGGKG